MHCKCNGQRAYRTTGRSPWPISLIGLVAVINGALIQMIMGSRVLYGLAQQGQIFAAFATINRRTRTPITATVAVTGAVLFFALVFPLENLARLTSWVVLIVFAIVNLALGRCFFCEFGLMQMFFFVNWPFCKIVGCLI